MNPTRQCGKQTVVHPNRLAVLKQILIRALMMFCSISICTVAVTHAQSAPSKVPVNTTAQEPGSPRCVKLTLAVALAQGQAANSQISGELCLPLSGQADVVQVAVHGATYDHRYWNWPQQPLVYSYASFMTRAGYAVFEYDRIGDGLSSHPSSTDISVTEGAYVAHQVVQALRSGQLGGYTFKRVLAVGHSLGSYITIQEAGTYKDVDALIVTGIAHAFNAGALPTLGADLYPAQLDPAFSDLGLDAGYLTTVPNTRGLLFYNKATADPAVIAYDESTKQTTTATELAVLEEPSAASPYAYASQIQVPVLLVDGQTDLAFCQGSSICSNAATLKAAEDPFYSPAAKLQTFVVPFTGHDINLHVTAPVWYGVALGWAISTVGL